MSAFALSSSRVSALPPTSSDMGGSSNLVPRQWLAVPLGTWHAWQQWGKQVVMDSGSEIQDSDLNHFFKFVCLVNYIGANGSS